MAAREANATGQETIAVITMDNGYDGDDEPPSDGGGSSDDNHEPMTLTDDDEELFELDIALLRGVGNDEDVQEHRHGRHGAGGDGAHALLANCLVPASSVSKAVPVTAAASSIISSYQSSGYSNSSSRRFLFTGGGGRQEAGSRRRRQFQHGEVLVLEQGTRNHGELSEVTSDESRPNGTSLLPLT